MTSNVPQQPPYPPPPPGQPPYPPPYQPPPKKGGAGKILLGVLIGVLGLCLLGGIVIIAAAGGGDEEPAGITAPTDGPAADTGSPAAAKTTPAAPSSAKPTPPPKNFRTITEREWKLIAKDPDSHVGEAIIVHGEVWQFDAATGDEGFLAYVGGAYQKPEYGFVNYETNCALAGKPATLADIVEGDLFTAKVLVAGSLDYDTQIGGGTTVPMLTIVSIDVTGSTA